jgi:6,7-dimethyl-8-ribityllumazine synthase
MAQVKNKNAKISKFDAHILVVEGCFYTQINDGLKASCLKVLEAAGVEITLLTVPGALEIPQAVSIATAYVAYDGVVALGCVIRGETGHYDIVANETNRALMDFALREGLPLGNAVLTVENEGQALARLAKGGEAAQACLALVAINQKMAAQMGDTEMDDNV